MNPEVAPPGGMSGPPGWFLRVVKDQRVAFLMVGGINVAVGFICFVGFLALFDQGTRPVPFPVYMATLVCSHVVAVLIAFVLYRFVVFRVRGHVLGDLWRFETVYLLSLGINSVALPLLVEFAHLPVIVAQALITFFTALMSYVGHKNFSFRRTQSPEDLHR